MLTAYVSARIVRQLGIFYAGSVVLPRLSTALRRHEVGRRHTTATSEAGRRPANDVNRALTTEGAETVGVCGATSTPLWLMEKVAETVRVSHGE